MLTNLPYVEVAAKISTRFAELNLARTRANTMVKSAVRPILAFVDCKTFKTKIVRTGNIVERIVATMVLALSIFRLSYDTPPPSKSTTLPVLR
jgi:hypothetical protein